ncbi:MAG: hypothetical protein KKA10_10210 [Euryarchaeota archaeon]|nr:hypothetical protein [Euryarchaeota archaeon]
MFPPEGNIFEKPEFDPDKIEGDPAQEVCKHGIGVALPSLHLYRQLRAHQDAVVGQDMKSYKYT